MRKLVFSRMLVMCAALTSVVACVSNEPALEQADDSFAEEVYFITGRVLYGQEPLEGVKVSIADAVQGGVTNKDGSYQLFLNRTGEYSLRFEKEDFVPITVWVAFPSEAENRSSMTISPVMTKMNGGVTVNPEDEVEISDPTGRATLRIKRAITKTTEVGLTVYKDVVAPSLQAQSYGVEYRTVAIEPQGTELAKNGILLVNNQVSDSLWFETVDLYQKETDGSWKKLDEVSFNRERNGYEAEISHLSTYSFRIPYSVEKDPVESVSSHLNGSQNINNCGNVQAKENVEITVLQRCGWDFVADIGETVRQTFPGISTADEAGMIAIVTDQISSLEGGYPGYYDVPVTILKTGVSGNAVMNYKNYAKEAVLSYSFKVSYLGQSYSLPVAIKKYTGMEEIYSNTSCHQHSGGQGK